MLALDDRKLPTGERAAAAAERAPLADRVLDVHCAVAEDARFALARRRARDRGRVGGRLPLRAGVRAGRLDVACLEPMMAPVAALCTGEDLELAQPGQRASATFRVRVTRSTPSRPAGRG